MEGKQRNLERGILGGKCWWWLRDQSKRDPSAAQADSFAGAKEKKCIGSLRSG
jgi:hypothetical protein